MMKIDNDVDEGRPPDSRSEQPRILSRLRNLNNLAMNSISSLFSGPLSSIGRPRDFDSAAGHDYDLWNSAYDLEMARTPNALEENDQFLAQYDQDIQDVKNLTAEASTPTQTRSNSPLHSNRFQDVKNTFTSFARSRQTDFYGQMHSGYPLLDESQHPPLASSTTLSSIVSASVSCSDHFVTPPLTPDIIDDHILLSPEATSYGQDIRYDPYCSAGRPIDNDEDTPRTQPYSLEIKEGKKPERLVCYDSVIDDVPGLHKARSAASTKSQAGATTDDRDEWYGLEYTLELSSRERRPSDTQSLSPGEHSKSRESWAAIHQGTIHPFFEDEDYYQWKNWHRYLDRQDERRKHKKGLEFKARSKHFAWIYVDEFTTRDVMYWQQEEYGANTRDVIERLVILAENRPDPYIPPMKHNLAWYLKRSRSVACLRELRSLPSLNPDEDHKFAALQNDDD